MQVLLFIFYCIFFSYFFYIYKLDKNTGISIKVIIGLFLFKVFGGCVNLYIHYNDYITNDIGFYFEQSVHELTNMKNNPTAFFKEWLFNWGDSSGKINMFERENMSFWSSIGMQVHYKYMTLANMFSLGNVYVNVILFNVMYFIGQLYLYKTLYLNAPHKKYLFLVVVFLIPSVVFWCSGIHKDGIILSCIGFVSYFIYQYLSTKNSLLLIASTLFLSLLFVTRYFYLLCIFPPLLLWIFTFKSKFKLLIFSIAYLIAFVILFNINELFPAIKPLELISNRQKDFIHLIGYSDMKTPILENHFMSYVKNFPTALNHILLKPSFHYNDYFKYKISAIDSWFVCSLIILFSAFIKRKNLNNGFFLFLLFFGATVYLFIGYTIPNAGALIRYKSEFTVVLLSALVGLSEVPFLKRVYSKEII